MENDGGPAFPSQPSGADAMGLIGGAHFGMSLRDYFAAQALMFAETIENSVGTRRDAEKELGLKDGEYSVGEHFPILVSRRAYMIADAMLKARSQ